MYVYNDRFRSVGVGGLQSVRSGPRNRRQGVSPPEGPGPPDLGGTPPGGGGALLIKDYLSLQGFGGPLS